MALLRVSQVEPLDGLRLKLTLTDGSIVVRGIADLLVDPVFEPIRNNSATFAQVLVEGGTVVWPNGADLCPDVLIWGGPPPETQSEQIVRSYD